MDEDALMRQTANDDTEAFGQLVCAYQQRLVRFARRLLGDGEAAEDVVQDAFVRLWRARSRYRPQGHFEHYVLRLVRNLCLDHLRAAHPIEPFDEGDAWAQPPDAGPADVVQARSLAEAVRSAVQRLPEPQRAVFILSQYKGLSYQQIADVLECPLGTVASRKHLAIETLRRRLKPWIEEEQKR